MCSFVDKENGLLKINANYQNWFVFYFDYAYLIRLSDVTKPTKWQLPLQYGKYINSNTHNFPIFSSHFDKTGIIIHGF